jgi:glycosyltransferase involved in cell wall biosynthesis
LRILVVSHEYPPVGGGGARIIEDLCRGLAGQGHELVVLTTHIGDLSLEEEANGVKVIRLRCGRKVPYRARFSEMVRYVFASFIKGWQIIKLWRPDLMHVHFAVPAGVSTMVLSKVKDVPYVLTAHLGDVPGGAPEKTDRWFRWIYPFTPPIWKSAARVVAVSEYTRHLALKHYPVDIRVIHNGFDLQDLKPEKIKIGDPPNVVWAGRFVPDKNPVQVVRTLAGLRDLDWNCVMLGDGPDRLQVKAEIKRYDLDDRIELPGWTSQEEVMACFAKSDVLFMPSFTEGLPIVGLQALVLGLAIVATRVGGFVELVDPDFNGYLVEDAVGNGFSDPLRELLSNPEKLLSFRKASIKIADQFDIRQIVQSYNDLFREIGSAN